MAAYWGRQDLVDLLRERAGPLSLWDAAIAGDAAAVGTALSADPALVRSESPDGFTALHLAAFFGHPETVRLLIERGAPGDAWTNNTFHNQPLHAAVAGSDPATRLAIARLLLDAGAAPGAQQSDGSTPLMAAARHGDAALVDLLLAAGAEIEPATTVTVRGGSRKGGGPIALAERLAPT